MLRINKALKSYKDAVKAIHDGQVKLKEIKKWIDFSTDLK